MEMEVIFCKGFYPGFYLIGVQIKHEVALLIYIGRKDNVQVSM